MDNKFLIILLGATGDLARKKLLPALYQLYTQATLPSFYIIGAAFEENSSQNIWEGAQPFITEVAQENLQHLISNTHYIQLNFTQSKEFKKLASYIKEHFNSTINRIVYCATPASLFCSLTVALMQEGIIWHEATLKNSWCRVVYEKPFGQSQKSAHEINQCIATYLNERQIYRVDHYLGKDVIGSLGLLRFTNRMFEPLWNHRNIEWIEIVLSESNGIEHRGSYYDAYGALKDVVQNHMLQMLALITMESPTILQGNYIRDQKAKVLQQIRLVDGLLGQYEGYQKEAHVNPTSTTETFAALKLAIDNERWQGVPFYLKTGKFLNQRLTKIIVQFKKVECLLSKKCPSPANYLEISITPQANVKLAVNVKKVGLAMEVEQVLMNFNYEHHFSPGAISGYEAVLEEVVRGDQSISVRFDEIEYAWQLIDHIKSANLPLFFYKRGSTGPRELEEFQQRNKVRLPL